MRFTHLEVERLRNLTQVSVEPGSGINLFYGPNGAGKTALLEAVHLLCRGRSFRTRKTRTLIQHDQPDLIVRGVLEDEYRGDTTLALRKGRDGRTEMYLNGAPERRLSRIAGLTPLQVMLPDMAELVFGPPAKRRSWLDWGTFHVKPDYLETLRAYLRAVRQRNALIREFQLGQSGDVRSFESWSEEAARLGTRVAADRQLYLELVAPQLRDMLKRLAPELNVSVHLRPGWPEDRELHKLLCERSPREVKYGATLWGPHRADVELLVDGAPAAAHLSRGQGKLLASALQIAQAALLADRDNRATVFLIDDVGAELDSDHNARFFGLLREIGSQVLATTSRRPERLWPGAENGLDRVEETRRKEPPDLVEGDEYRHRRWIPKVFHVKHGHVDEEV